MGKQLYTNYSHMKRFRKLLQSVIMADEIYVSVPSNRLHLNHVFIKHKVIILSWYFHRYYIADWRYTRIDNVIFHKNINIVFHIKENINIGSLESICITTWSLPHTCCTQLYTKLHCITVHNTMLCSFTVVLSTLLFCLIVSRPCILNESTSIFARVRSIQGQVAFNLPIILCGINNTCASVGQVMWGGGWVEGILLTHWWLSLHWAPHRSWHSGYAFL